MTADKERRLSFRNSIDPEGQQHTVHNAATGMDPFLVAQAQAAAEREKSMPFSQAFRKYYPGILWSAMLSVALIMEGFDVSMINSYWGQPYFLEHFGTIGPDGEKHIPANWQAGMNNAASVGQVVGLSINGYCQYRFGSRRTYLCAMTAMIAAIFMPVFATNLPMLFGGEVLCGIPWGVFQTLTTTYAAELCPMAVRAHLTSFVNICWAAGLFIGAGVVRGTLSIESNWSWRLPYMMQWLWPVPLLVGCYFAPESPWYLARVGKYDEARDALSRTAAKGAWDDNELDAQVALIRHTLELERQEHANASILNCFRGTNLRRTEICCIVWMIQNVCGQGITGYISEFLQIVGLSTDQAFDLNLGSYGMLVFGTICVWFGMGTFGRRKIYIGGQVGMAILMLAIGILGVVGTDKKSTAYAVAALLLLLNLTFACTVGPACYTIVAELPAAEVRGPTVVLARMTYVISGICVQQLYPRQIAKTEWNWGAKAGFFWLGTNLLGIAYCYFRLPESAGRTFGELDVLFANGVSARRFASTDVDEFEGDEAVLDAGKVDIVHKE